MQKSNINSKNAWFAREETAGQGVRAKSLVTEVALAQVLEHGGVPTG